MLLRLMDVSIRSLPLALVAAALLWTLQRKRTAAMRHAVWTAVVCGMLALFAFGSAMPRLPLRVLSKDAPATPAAPPFAVAAPLILDDVPIAVRPPVALHRSIDWGSAALYAYSAITLIFLGRFLAGIFLVRRLLMKSESGGAGFRESAIVAVPLTIGVMRPQILLPLEWRQWDSPKLNAVLAHEGAHARRRDGLVAALAGINRCIFWFHPLAWWLERRLALLAELACDESCIATLGNREDYARLLLEMALVVDESQGRLRQHALTMAAGSHIRQRVDSLLQENRMFSRGVTWTAWTAIALCGIPIVWGAGAITLDRESPLLQLAMPRLEPPAPPVLMAQGRPTAAPPALVPPPRPQFATAFVTLSNRNSPLPKIEGGQVEFNASLTNLVAYAFGIPPDQVAGLTRDSWIDVVATLPQGASEDQVPEMLQAFLADRFKLAAHRERRDQEVVALVVAEGGLKLKPVDPDAPPDVDPLPPPPRGPRLEVPGGTFQGLAGILTRKLSRLLASERLFKEKLLSTVFDMTGLNGGYLVVFDAPRAEPIDTLLEMPGVTGFATGASFGLTANGLAVNAPTPVAQPPATNPFAPPLSTVPAAELPPGPSHQARQYQEALQKLGLQLEMREAQVEFIVVDHMEQAPTAN